MAAAPDSTRCSRRGRRAVGAAAAVACAGGQVVGDVFGRGGRQMRLGAQLSLADLSSLLSAVPVFGGAAAVLVTDASWNVVASSDGGAGCGGASERIGVGVVQRQRPRAERGSLVARGVPGAELGDARPRAGSRLGTGQGGRRAGVLGVAAGVGWRPDERAAAEVLASQQVTGAGPGVLGVPSVWW